MTVVPSRSVADRLANSTRVYNRFIATKKERDHPPSFFFSRMEDDFWEQLVDEDQMVDEVADNEQIEQERTEGNIPSTSAGPLRSFDVGLIRSLGPPIKKRELKIIDGKKIGFCTYQDGQTQTIDNPTPPEERVQPLTISQCSVCIQDYRAEGESCLKITKCKPLLLFFSF